MFNVDQALVTTKILSQVPETRAPFYLGAFKTLHGPSGWTESMVIDPTGRFFLTTFLGKNIKIWDAQYPYNQIAQLEAHQKPITALAIDPQGRFFVTASEDATAKIWEINLLKRTFSIRNVITGHTDKINAIATGPEGVIVTGSADKTAKVWLWTPDWKTILLGTIEGHKEAVSAVAIEPQNAFIATGSTDGRVMLWDRATFRRIKELLGHTGAIRRIAIDPYGKFLVSGSDDATARVWHATGELLSILRGHFGGIRDVAINKEGTYIATASTDKTVRIWTIDRVAKTFANQGMLFGHSAAVNAIMIDAKNSNLIISGSSDLATNFWNITSLWSDQVQNFLQGKMTPEQAMLISLLSQRKQANMPRSFSAMAFDDQRLSEDELKNIMQSLTRADRFPDAIQNHIKLKYQIVEEF